MIRLREQDFPPVYQLELALQLIRSGQDGRALKILKAEPLYDTRTVEVTHRNTVDTIYSDGTFFDPYTPIYAPGREITSVKVAYTDALEEYQTAIDALW
jgi:hypothetical protein